MSEKDSDQVRDTEITLNTGKLLGIFFALAVLCGVFFTMGYLLGRSTGSAGRTEIVGSLPAGNTTAKPVAGNKAAQPQASTCPPDSPNCAAPAASGDSSATSNSSSARNTDASASQPSSAGKTADTSAPSAPDSKSGTGGSFMVQVAAVTRQEDAEILKNELQKKKYPVFIANSSGDPLFHVQVGPFTDRKDADAMKTRLAGDGYNAIVK